MEKATRLHLTKDDTHLKAFNIWKNVYKQLVDVHNDYSKNLLDVALNAELAFRTETDQCENTIMVDIGQVLINELKSQSKIIQNQWEGYNKNNQPFQLLSIIDGKTNRMLHREVHDACSERKQIEHKLKHTQKKFFQSFDLTRATIEKLEMEDEDCYQKQELKTQLTSLKSKTDVYLAKYKSTFQTEYENRSKFQQKMTDIQNKWMEKEKENLDIWRKCCGDLCFRLDKSSARVFTNPLDSQSPYPALMKKISYLNIDKQVLDTLARKLEEHVFPVFKERRMEDLQTPQGSRTQLNKEKYVPSSELMNAFIVNSQQSDGNVTQERPHGRRGKHKHSKSSPRGTKEEIPVKHTLDQEEIRLDDVSDSDSDSDLEVIHLEGEDTKREIYHQNARKTKEQKFNDLNYIPSSTSDISHESTTPRKKTYYQWHDEDLDTDKLDSRAQLFQIKNTSSPNILQMKNVYVSVIKDYQSKSKDEITLKIGMNIKQKRIANEKGMAYGWYKAKKMGVKKYGYYPTDHVILLQRSSWSSIKIKT